MKLPFSALFLILFTLGSAGAVGYVDSWGIFDEPLPDRSTWAAHYRRDARVKLGPEQRLPNGIAWRLHTDTKTGVAFPRLTWMPSTQSLRVANDLLETAHGGALLDAQANERRLRYLNELRKEWDWPQISFGLPITQMDVAITYASNRLVSVIDLGLVRSEGNHETKIIRGLTLDLERERINRVKACPRSDAPYGWNWDLTKGNFQFVFGALLDVCSEKSYRDFVRLLLDYAERGAKAAARSDDPYVLDCIEYYSGNRRRIGENQEVVLYLTFDGLAVFNTTFWPEISDITCASKRSALNPVIIPYTELKPFMIEGPWRDELLALPATKR